MSKKTLSKCPLCGNEVSIVETRLTGFGEMSATLECRCGIRFTKKWYPEKKRGAVIRDNRDIYDAWNDRYKEEGSVE